ncbi:hypothetical protein [Comamonas avium]|uniref:Uncharacterized protein n=1 Tax=Comamonas avium TaxID=2762231 RepID=A0ABR8SEY2_9BURK|nr:hypothetical protein [Comamonas avium]MBD7962027.1 hypothetical protein [Comamonas avium]
MALKAVYVVEVFSICWTEKLFLPVFSLAILYFIKKRHVEYQQTTEYLILLVCNFCFRSNSLIREGEYIGWILIFAREVNELPNK